MTALVASAVMLLALALQPRGASAQDSTVVSDSLSADSLAARLERAEAAIALLREHLSAQAGSAVQTRSRARFELFGRVLTNAFANNRRVNNVDVPLFVRPDTASALPVGGAGMSLRQTMLGGAVTVPDLLGAAFRGDLEVDFFGGQHPSSGGRHFPLLRLRTARSILTWPHGELLVGQETPLVAGLNPVSVASVGTPGFVAAGNLWLWLPQIRLTGEVGRSLRLALQGAVLAPATGDAAGAFDTDVDAAERSRRPFLEGRIRLRWGSDESEGEVGAGVHHGWLATAGDSLLTSRAVTADVRLPLGPFELRGEMFRGRLLRGLGGGAIGQSFGAAAAGAPAPPLDAIGGWAQLNVRATATHRLGAGCGADDPDDDDRPLRQRNVACAAYVTWRPVDLLLFGFEYRRIETTYAAGRVANDHLNLAVGFEF